MEGSLVSFELLNIAWHLSADLAHSSDGVSLPLVSAALYTAKTI
jgi:hypothetical protein